MSPPKVLVAEDDPAVRLSLELLLEVEGYEVFSAEDGEAAVSLASELLPDAILLDHMMPKLSGREVLEILRAAPMTRGIPVLVLTGMGREDSGEWPDAIFVGKPFSPDRLLKVLHDALRRSGEVAAAPR